MHPSEWLRNTYTIARCKHAAVAALAFYMVTIGPSLAYDRKDAGYVTSSKNRAVLNYIVCLEGVVADTPKRMDIEASLDQAEAKCKSKAAKLPRSGSVPNAEDLRYTIMECGFRPGEASPDMACGGSASAETETPVIEEQAPVPQATNGQYILSNAETSAIINGVRGRLKDPASAIFGGVVAKKEASGFVYVCGSINAKNSFGGYTGDQPYSGMLTGEGPTAFFAVLGIGGGDGKREAIVKVCHGKGLL